MKAMPDLSSSNSPSPTGPSALNLIGAAPPPGGWRVRLLDLSVRDPDFRAALLDAVGRVLDHGRFILGPEHDEFERAVADWCGRKWCVGVGSGTDALYLALRALDLGPGDEVITTPLTWVATTNAIVLTGATPVFADVDSDFNIDPGRIEALIGPRTRAIVPVHFTGRMCDMAAIAAIARDNGLRLVEDAAQSFGAEYRGKPAGGFGDVACFSMNPMKVFNAFGEAGAVVTDDEALRDRLASLRYAGTINKEDCHWPSINGRLDTVQAAMMLVNLPRVRDRIAARQRVAARYTAALGNVVGCPRAKDGFRHSWYSYTIVAERRDALKAFLAEKGVETKIQHPLLTPHHAAYRGKFTVDIPNAEHLVRRILCLPLHEDLGDDDIAYVADCVRAFYEGDRP